MRNYLLVSLLAALGACGGDPDNDAVECTETCDSNASCDTSGDVGVCVCDDGFTGDGITCEADDICAGVSTCDTEGITCSGDDLVTCEADADGCLIASTVDCTASEQVCYDDGTEAVCADECSDAPACEGLSDGDSFCDGNTPTTCDAGAGGCLEANPGTACMLDVCDTTGGPATCVANASGDSCAEAFLVLDDVNLVGTDITADYTDVEAFTGEGCAATSSTTGVDAVFTVPLSAGQSVNVSEHGGVDIVLGIIPNCAGDAACYAGVDAFSGPVEEAGISYTALEDETVTVYASAFSAAPTTVDYDIRIDIATCGDGVTEGAETCDDANTNADDGCDVCQQTIGFDCDNTSVSVCTPPTDLGSYAAAEAIPDTVETGPLADEEFLFYTITFTDNVILSGTLVADVDGEDLDIGFFDEDGELVFSSATVGDEDFTGALPAGTYVIGVVAFGEVTGGWTLAMSTVNSCGDGIVNTSDECDDGNDIDDDRCSNTCLLNADVEDLDGNDDFMNAQALADGEVARGSTDPAADPFDLYTFTLVERSWVTLEQYTTVDGNLANYDGPGVDNTLDCPSGDPDIRVFAETGDPTDNTTAVIFDDSAGDGFCGYIGPEVDRPEAVLEPGTYYVKVSDFGDNDALPLYALDLKIDAVLGADDACDVAEDFCDEDAGLVCNPNTDTCTLPPVDRGFFEEFLAGQFDMSSTTVTYTPDGTDYLAPTVAAAAGYPDTPGSGAVATSELVLSDDDNELYTSTVAIPFFGEDQTEFFVGSNGFVSFGAGFNTATESVSSHFSRAQVALFWDDLAPNVGGTITVDEFADRVTVTYDAVRAFSSTNTISVQAQFFDTGVIVVTYLTVQETDCIIGISAGDGIGNPPDETDFSALL